jgi:hypothetical protein
MTIRTPRFLITALATGAAVSIAPLHVPPVKQVSLTIQTPMLVVGATTTTTVVAKRANGDTASTKNATWGISKPDVATITMTSGVIKAIAPGTATITTIVSGVTGAAVLTVTAPPPPPPPPPAAVATVAVSLGLPTLAPGQTTQATAIARDSSGDVLTNRTTLWTSSVPTIASITTTGLVTAVNPGAAIIRAAVDAKSATATLTVAVPQPPLDTTHPPPTPGHPNEPTGFTQLSPTLSGDSVPLTVYGPNSGAAYELGWVQGGTITQQIDSAVPFTSKKVLQAFFPSGFIGGSGPTHTWTASSTNPQSWPGGTPSRSPLSLYLSFWYKISPNFPINLVANKITYEHLGDHPVTGVMLGASSDYPLDANGIAHLVQNGATQYTAAVYPVIAFQQVEIDGTHFDGVGTNQMWFSVAPESLKLVKRGQWHHWEVLVIRESDGGHGDGTAKLWLDGNLIINWDHRIRFYPASTTPPVWNWVEWATVYGGGGSVPNDGIGGYHRMKDLYVSGKP